MDVMSQFSHLVICVYPKWPTVIRAVKENIGALKETKGIFVLLFIYASV